MKNYSFPGIWALSLGLLMVACQPEPIAPDTTDTPIDHCQIMAEVLENDCGLFLEVEGGKRYYAEDTRGVSLRAGMQVLMGYVPTTASTDDGSGGCNSGYCGSGSSSSSSSESSSHSSSDPAENSLENCMARNGVSPARLLCIQVLSTDGSADETTR